jgi:uncharacterized protein YgbK (DUF1537 family)
MTRRTHVLLDDDPTGPQLSADVPVLLRWLPDDLAAVLSRRPTAVHVVTNTRSLDPTAAGQVTQEAATAARTADPDCHLVLRGDSTLRGHLLEEYDAVRRAAFVDGTQPVLLLVPAMPSAGRITVDGVHRLVRAGRAVPLSQTEYARDAAFAYSTARLLDYAQERSRGRFAASRGHEVPLEQLRRQGPAAVADALAAAATSAPAVVVPDAVTVPDLELIRAGLMLAEARGVPVITRCAPAFAALLAGGVALPVAPPATPDGILVVCGSYVQNTTRQLAVLRDRIDPEFVEADVRALASPTAAEEIARVARLAARALRVTGVAVLTTPRTRPADLVGLDAGRRIATNLASAAAQVRPRPSVVVTKGGITSAVTLRDGFGVHRAVVAGPLLTGISLWYGPHGRPDFVIFPGNVGDEAALADLVEVLQRRQPIGDGTPAPYRRSAPGM